MSDWQPIETAPRDGREILAVDDGGLIRVARPKLFPRPLRHDDDLSTSKPGDVWEVFSDHDNCPGHTWSMVPTHWMPLPAPPDTGDGR